MAKFTAILGLLSGSISGNTFSRNRFGPYVRVRAVPVNPRTPIQTERRNTFALYSSLWRSLSEGQRNAWKDLAASFSESNPLGFPSSITGQNLYVGFNVDQLLIGNAPQTTPPAVGLFAEYGTPALVVDTAPADLVTITLPLVSGPGGNRIQVYATAPYSAGITFVKPSAYRLLTSEDGTNLDTTVDVTTLYEALFGELGAGQVGQKVSFKLVPYSENGYRGTPVETIAIIT